VTSDRMADHWWWRPGWRPGRRMYTWHITFGRQPAVRDLAARYQATLAGLPGLDLVPTRWLHLTTQGVGFTDEVGDDDLAAVISAARDRLAAICPVRVTLGPAQVTPEAILLDVSPAGEIMAIRTGLRAAISEVWPASRVPEPAAWMPHVSIAYSNTTAPSKPYTAALAECGETTQGLIQTVDLIVLQRDQHMYEWTTRAEVPLSPHHHA
jgi:2'-5' RNA ligase